MLTVGSLFAGVGGFDLGLERAGMRTVWFCEQDEFCRGVLAKHWPGVPCYPDVRALVADTAGGRRPRPETTSGTTRDEPGAQPDGPSSDGVPVPVPYVDVLCGGFPCQDLSVAGKGAGIDGERSGLWGEYARLIRELRPRYVVVENVAALLGRGLGRVLGDLAACGYDAEWDCIPASAVGAPHRRDRLWIVAYPQSPEGRRGTVGGPGGDGRPGVHGEARDVTDPQRDTVRERPGRRNGQDGSGAPFVAVDGEARSVAHTGSERRSARPEQGTWRETTVGSQASHIASGCGEPFGGWWQSEPDVRLLADGLSEGVGLDAGNADGPVADTSSAPEGLLRGVWEHVAARAASRGRRPDEQLARELADALSQLSHDLALEQRQDTVAFATAYVRGLRQACEAIGAVRNASDPLAEAWLSLSAEDQAWVEVAVGGGQWAAEWPGVGRVSRGEQNRVDRLAALGNALVPQIAEWLGRRIVEAEEQLT